MRSLASRLWLVPALLTLHNVEEAVSMPWFLGSGHLAVPGVVGRLVGVPSVPQFLVALSVVTALPVVFALLLFAARTASAGRFLLLLTQAVVFVNVFAHLAGAVVARGYAPGLVTAVCINLPYSCHLGAFAVRAGWRRPRDVVPLLLGALVVHGPGLVALLIWSGWVVRR